MTPFSPDARRDLEHHLPAEQAASGLRLLAPSSCHSTTVVAKTSSKTVEAIITANGGKQPCCCAARRTSRRGGIRPLVPTKCRTICRPHQLRAAPLETVRVPRSRSDPSRPPEADEGAGEKRSAPITARRNPEVLGCRNTSPPVRASTSVGGSSTTRYSMWNRNGSRRPCGAGGPGANPPIVGQHPHLSLPALEADEDLDVDLPDASSLLRGQIVPCVLCGLRDS